MAIQNFTYLFYSFHCSYAQRFPASKYSLTLNGIFILFGKPAQATAVSNLFVLTLPVLNRNITKSIHNLLTACMKTIVPSKGTANYCSTSPINDVKQIRKQQSIMIIGRTNN